MKKIFLITIFSIAVLGLSSVCAFAESGRSRNEHGYRAGRRQQVIVVKAGNHHYAQKFRRPSLFWFGQNSRLAIGVVVARLPYGHRTIIVGGSTYHRHNNTYYRACRTGYLVVPAPC